MAGLGMGDVDLKNHSMTCVGALAQNEWLVRKGFKVENGGGGETGSRYVVSYQVRWYVQMKG